MVPWTRVVIVEMGEVDELEIHILDIEWSGFANGLNLGSERRRNQ